VSSDELVRFLESPTAALYGAVCERWGQDPAAFLDDDDVLAFNFRAGLSLVMARRDKPDPGSPDAVADTHRHAVEETKRRAAEMKTWVS